MSGFVKGGVFVGAAVAAGLLVGFLVPPLVVGREHDKGGEANAQTLPSMPNIIGRPLDQAENELARNGITYVTDSGDIFGIVVPSVWEVCETEPGTGETVRGTAHVRAALPTTCSI
jgi:PASTA domain